jgi:hypothetical protein
MIKLSELENEVIVIDENLCIYTVGEVKNDLKYFRDKNKKLYTTTKYHASIDALDMLEMAVENEYCNNMYEDWDDYILKDITNEDIEKIQIILDDILSRNKEQNTAYYEDEEIDIFN